MPFMKQDNKGLVSIIIPVYNAEQYIEKCIESVLAQTYTNLEIIMIDDGSKDHSGAICDQYAQKDNRIRVIHQANGGVSVARQAGLDAAKGEYITHIDPDDWVEKEAIRTMFEIIEEKGADIVFCDFYEDRSNQSAYRKQNPKEYDNKSLLIQMLHFDGFFPMLWNSLVKHEIIYKYEVSFTPTDIQIGEDTLFLSKLLNKNCKVSFCPRAFYHYNVDNTSSITRRISRKRLLSRFTMINALAEELGEDFSEHFYPIKKSFLFAAFSNRHFDFLDKYPEIHQKVIDDGAKYNLFKPISSCLSMSLRTNPRMAYFFYFINTRFIRFYNTIKMLRSTPK